ncbi:MAG: hypothetical protein JNJ57_06795 [Saprospiraceae bacterium]|nr:hypothetical protein [Saprospiraceae bacterium]
MKYKSLLLLSAILITTGIFSACLRDECTSQHTYVRMDPVYKPFSEIRQEIKFESPKPLKKPGKIFALGAYLFINEQQEGIHVIDNSDPSNPQQIAFWNIPGNLDLIIKGNFLYADQYIDLLTIDVSDLQNPQEVCREKAVFPLFGFDPTNGYIIDYKQTEVTEKINCSDSNWGQLWFRRGDVLFLDAPMAATAESSGGIRNLSATLGISGSYARFGFADNYLYTVDNWMLRSWTLENPSCPKRVDSTYLGWNAETIFPWKDRLFIGTQSGVFIFNNSNPAHPVLESQFTHATGCDPVVCDDKHAYVTIHDGTTCNGTFNQLDIIDVQNLPSASLQRTYPMKRPFGLSITNDLLFLCDDGLKIFDRTDPLEIKQLSHLSNLATYDVIAFSNEHIMVVGDDGFYQFDVTDPSSPRQISAIPVEK